MAGEIAGAVAEDYRRARLHGRLQALALVAPLLFFILVTFAAPIAAMLTRSVYNPEFAEILPETVAALGDWDRAGPPGEQVFAALAADLARAREAGAATRAATRLNFEYAGGRSLLTQAAREAGNLKPPYAEAFAALDPRWQSVETWAAIALAGERFTATHYLAAADLRYAPDGRIVAEQEENQIYVTLFLRTLWVAGLVTLLTLILGYPVAYVLAHLPLKMSNLLMILVLLPFWTSLLVRTTSWIVLLQGQGVINSLLVGIGLVPDPQRLELIYNATGTTVAMTHILLPFMILPLYSVMRTISPAYVRAAQSMGAAPFVAFLRVYAPLTVPGAGAGALLVFILAMGYYITPALVGGRTGQLISNMIAYHMQSSLNWGLAAALGGVLLAGVLALYFLYARIVGIERMRLA